MENHPERDVGRRVAVFVFVVALLLPATYLVSSAPVEWLMAHGYVSYDNPFVEAFYYPGELLMRLCPPLNDFVRWYLALWK